MASLDIVLQSAPSHDMVIQLAQLQASLESLSMQIQSLKQVISTTQNISAAASSQEGTSSTSRPYSSRARSGSLLTPHKQLDWNNIGVSEDQRDQILHVL